ncbi:DUF1380 family protein [Mangrovibacter phragmitis]|uniref:DUF1380 family protein n=1 Tax=Mangrovibacter phragmitis TaxID=1691903 RepID=UPI00336A9D3A
MYGTTTEICIHLLTHFIPGENMTVLVLTEDDIRELTPGMHPTPDEARQILSLIASADGLEFGVSEDTVITLLSSLREAETGQTVTVPAQMLRAVMHLAGREMERIADCAREGGGDAEDSLREENHMMATLHGALGD